MKPGRDGVEEDMAKNKRTPSALEALDAFIESQVGVHTAEIDCTTCGKVTTWTYLMNEPKGWLDNQCGNCGDWWFDQNPPEAFVVPPLFP